LARRIGKKAMTPEQKQKRDRERKKPNSTVSKQLHLAEREKALAEADTKGLAAPRQRALWRAVHRCAPGSPSRTSARPGSTNRSTITIRRCRLPSWPRSSWRRPRIACCSCGRGVETVPAALASSMPREEQRRSAFNSLLVSPGPHDPPTDAAGKPDDADDQGKYGQRPFQIVGRRCVEHLGNPDRYET
jgi:hypothetical protein